MTFEQANLHIIKCQNKQTNDELKELHYQLNGYILKHLKRLITPYSNNYVIKQLINYGVKINNLSISNKDVQKKQNEILSQLKMMIKQLGSIVFETNQEYNTESVQKYVVSCYLRQKENLSIQQIINILNEIKEIKEEYQISNPIKSLQNANSELLTLLNNYYQ